MHFAPVFTLRSVAPIGAPLTESCALIGPRAVNHRCLHQTLRGGISQVIAQTSRPLPQYMSVQGDERPLRAERYPDRKDTSLFFGLSL